MASIGSGSVSTKLRFEDYIEPEIDLQIPERAELARLLRNQPENLTDEDIFQLRIKVTCLTLSLCGNKESSETRKRGTGNRDRTQASAGRHCHQLKRGPRNKSQSPI